MRRSIMCPALPVGPVRVVAGVRAAPSMGDHQARRTMDAVQVMVRKRRHVPAHPPVQFL